MRGRRVALRGKTTAILRSDQTDQFETPRLCGLERIEQMAFATANQLTELHQLFAHRRQGKVRFRSEGAKGLAFEPANGELVDFRLHRFDPFLVIHVDILILKAVLKTKAPLRGARFYSQPRSAKLVASSVPVPITI